MAVEFPYPPKIPSSGNVRPWLTIAEELAAEQNPKHLAELTEELCRALDEQGPTRYKHEG
jgi:hypothetical protein